MTAAWAAVVDAINLGPGMRVLDVGCGDGGFCALAAGRGAEVSGIDADPAAVARARRRLPSADLRLGFMEALPWLDDSFDAVVGFNAFQYALDIDLALLEAMRVLRPGGRVAVCKWGQPQDNEHFAVAVAMGVGRPEALRAEDPVEAAIQRVRLRVCDRGCVPVQLDVPDLDALAEATGLSDESVLAEQAAAFRQPDGSYRFAAGLAYVVAADWHPRVTPRRTES
jgi:cyclopropane fatty-acyl-phospholipid synthase-like methyltransferase